MPNPNFDQILSTTLANYRNKLEDNVFKKNPLLWFLTEKNSVRKISGGHKIVEQLLVAEGQSNTYGEWDAITITPQEGITAAEYPWRQLAATVAISGLQEAMNNGEAELIDLLQAKVMQAEKTMEKKMATMAYGDGTGNSNKDWLGLAALVGNNTVGPATVGGISATSNAYWRSQVLDKAGAANPATYFVKDLTKLYNAASDGSDVVQGIFTTATIFEFYESLLTPQVRYQDVKSANLGFQNLMFKQCPVYWDRNAPANTVWGVNPKYIRFVGHSNRWFKQSPFAEGLSSTGGTGVGSQVDARYSIITAYGNMTTSARDKHFRYTGLSTIT
jgi:hypothetical protein